jgi:hypothetical protein
MTIPLDNLYHYVEGLFPEPVCMYLFYPHGSKNILDLSGLRTYDSLGHEVDSLVFPSVICHDQEPLNYQYYEQFTPEEEQALSSKYISKDYWPGKDFSNIRKALPSSIYDKVILLHSEKNSDDVTLYEDNNYLTVYYWAHGLIARDWYRFADIDKRFDYSNFDKKDFLIYCREWTGSREYRLKFQELLVENNLHNQSITKIAKNIGQYKNYNFANPAWCPKNFDFMDSLEENFSPATYSAMYEPADFNETKISVVLETVFDSKKIHLTEKILRPIACGHPFVLAAGPGSLEYLKSYGFKTFSPWIDERYDQETSAPKRLNMIIDTLKSFSGLNEHDQKIVYENILKIAEYNKRWFFSNNFTELIVKELSVNIERSLKEINCTRAKNYRSRNKILKKNKPKRDIIAKFLKKIKNNNPPQ